jgi:glycosyltransferase involved in cell wall biosynthesis
MNFSVVIAAYNASSTICAALQSCVSQTFAVFEIIVVNDASTDNTLEIVKSFPFAIKTISFTENKGVSAARNAGWALATGEYVAFLDSDDLWHPEKLFWINESLKKFPETNFLSHQFTIDVLALNNRYLNPIQKEINFGNLLLKNKIQGSCIIIKRTVPFRFDESMRYCEDFDFALRCAYHQAIQFLKIPLTILSRPQQSNGGLSADKWAMRKGEMFLFSKLWQLSPLMIVFIPLLWLYSLAKFFSPRFK